MSVPVPEVDIVVVSFNTRDLLRRCLESIREHAGMPVRTVVVDNASKDGSAEMVAEAFPESALITSAENIGFACANNLGLRATGAPLVLFLNSDAALKPGALPALRACLEQHQDAVIAGPRLLNPDGSFQRSCRRFPAWARNLALYSGMTRRFPQRRNLDTWLDEAEHAAAREVDMVSGACFLARRDYVEALGGMDENLFLYEEELDLMLPARRQGKRVIYCREAEVIHHGGASVSGGGMSAFAQRQFFRSKYHVFRKHHGAAYARATYWTDTAIFQLSCLAGRLRGNTESATALLRAARRGWMESFIPAAELRKREAFWQS